MRSGGSGGFVFAKCAATAAQSARSDHTGGESAKRNARRFSRPNRQSETPRAAAAAGTAAPLAAAVADGGAAAAAANPLADGGGAAACGAAAAGGLLLLSGGGSALLVVAADDGITLYHALSGAWACRFHDENKPFCCALSKVASRRAVVSR